MFGSAPLPSHAAAVVVGGGAMGCSTLYHLARLGIRDAVLLERHRLTSGTTWHSAAQVRQLRSTRNLTRLIRYSTELYAALEAETGQSTGWRRTGSLSIATNRDRLIHIRRQAALARAYGVEAEEIGAAEVAKLWPLARTDDVIGAVFSPGDGRVNPSDFCQALVKGARAGGARVYEHTPVTGFLESGGRIAGVRTPAGEVRADTVIICGGLWSRSLAARAGAVAPLLPCEHFYLLTKPVPGLDAHLPTLSDHDAHLYIRDEVGGLLVGCFEPHGKPVDPAVLGEDFAFSLFDEDWDHFEPMAANAMHRVPLLEAAEVRTLLNGPESFTPDGAFLLGESGEVPGLYLGCGMNSMGVAAGGGAGWALAQWVIDGAPPFDLGEVDPRRFHRVENTLSALMERAPEVLGGHYEIAYPGRQWSSARDLRLTPLHGRWQAAGARFAQVYGWERPQYFASRGEPVLTFNEPEWFAQVGREVRAAHQHAAVFDQSTLGKIRVRGPDAERFLDRMCANDMTRPPGRAVYTAMLNPRGGFESDLTALRTASDEYLLYVPTGAVGRDMAWLRGHLAAGEQVHLGDETEAWAVLALMGPEAAAVARTVGANALTELGFFHHGIAEAAGVPVRAARLSYVGEAGWEITCAASDAGTLCDALVAAGAEPAGLLAQTSMRIEKRFAAMGHELDGDVSPLEAGLGFAVKARGGFVGHEALVGREGRAPRERLVSVMLDDPAARPLGDEPLYADGRLVGQATSAAFGYRVARPVLLAYLDATLLTDAAAPRLQVDIAGTRWGGTADVRAVFDPWGLRMRP